MTQQLVFDLPVHTGFGRADYFVSEANALAVAQVEDWANWTNGRLFLSGPAGSGKSHLLSIWADDVGAEVLAARDIANWQPKAFPRAVAIEDVTADTHQETLVLLINHIRAQDKPVLLTAETGPKGLGLTLQDLISRLEASTQVSLQAIDDTLFQAVFIKQITDRQLVLEPDLLDFALRRTERSLTMVKKLVERLDQLSLQKKKAVTKRLMSEAITALENEGHND